MKTEKIGNVWRTNDRQGFKHLNGNRGVERPRVQGVIDSINTVGYVMSPIVVNEKMEVIDGQARLQAFEELKLPVDFVIAYGAGVRECIYLNRRTSAWTMKDYIKSYNDLGSVPYRFLQALITAYGVLPFQVIVYALQIREIHQDLLKSGKFTCTAKDYEGARRLLDAIMEIKPILDRVGGDKRHICKAIMFALSQGLVDRSTLREKLEKFWSLMFPVANIGDALDMLENVYNYRNRNKIYGLKGRYGAFVEQRGKEEN